MSTDDLILSGNLLNDSSLKSDSIVLISRNKKIDDEISHNNGHKHSYAWYISSAIIVGEIMDKV